MAIEPNLASTLLCVVKLWWVREGAVELASDGALEYAADLAGGLALCWGSARCTPTRAARGRVVRSSGAPKLRDMVYVETQSRRATSLFAATPCTTGHVRESS